MPFKKTKKSTKDYTIADHVKGTLKALVVDIPTEVGNDFADALGISAKAKKKKRKKKAMKTVPMGPVNYHPMDPRRGA